MHPNFSFIKIDLSICTRSNIRSSLLVRYNDRAFIFSARWSIFAMDLFFLLKQAFISLRCSGEFEGKPLSTVYFSAFYRLLTCRSTPISKWRWFAFCLATSKSPEVMSATCLSRHLRFLTKLSISFWWSFTSAIFHYTSTSCFSFFCSFRLSSSCLALRRLIS